MSNKMSLLTPLDRFGELLIHGFRDKAIEQNEMLIMGKLRGKAVQDLQKRVMALPPEEKALIRDIVVDLVDVGLHDILYALQDAHDSELGIEVTVDGQNVAELSGMLHGEPLGPNGWIAKFSRYQLKNPE